MVVMYSIALGVRCFKWKMLSLSGPKALLFLQLFIAFITRSVLNVRTISNGFLLISLVTTLVSLEEVCLPSFEVFNSTAWSGLSFGPWFQQSLSIFSVCAHRYGSGWFYSILAVQVRWSLFYGGHLVCSSRPVSLLVQVPHGVCGVQ